MELKDVRDTNDYMEEIDKILTCFKLVYVEEITKDKSYDTFKMLGGEELFTTFSLRVGPNIFTSTNMELLNRLQSLINKINNKEINLTHSTRCELRHLDWLEEVELVPSETLIDTIFKNASPSVYEEKLGDSYTASYCAVDQKRAMVKCIDIAKSCKEI